MSRNPDTLTVSPKVRRHMPGLATFRNLLQQKCQMPLPRTSKLHLQRGVAIHHQNPVLVASRARCRLRHNLGEKASGVLLRGPVQQKSIHQKNFSRRHAHLVPIVQDVYLREDKMLVAAQVQAHLNRAYMIV